MYHYYCSYVRVASKSTRTVYSWLMECFSLCLLFELQYKFPRWMRTYEVLTDLKPTRLSIGISWKHSILGVRALIWMGVPLCIYSPEGRPASIALPRNSVLKSRDSTAATSGCDNFNENSHLTLFKPHFLCFELGTLKQENASGNHLLQSSKMDRSVLKPRLTWVL
jgi:hypothetical protein